MPFFGFSRASSLKNKKYKVTEPKNPQDKFKHLKLTRTTSCTVSSFPSTQKDENLDVPVKKTEVHRVKSITEGDKKRLVELKQKSPKLFTGNENMIVGGVDNPAFFKVINKNENEKEEQEPQCVVENSSKYSDFDSKFINDDQSSSSEDELAKEKVVLRRPKSTEKKTSRNRRRKTPITIHRRSQHYEDNPIDVKLRQRQSRNFEEDIEESKKDPLKRFEYLRNGKATSVMIRATPNAVRWDEINRVQYRFQALNFHSDVLEALIQNSPPLSRREQTAASKDKKNLIRHRDDNNNGSLSSDDESDNNNNNITKTKLPSLSRQVRAVRRTNSCDMKTDMDRKGSVVQIGTKDDTSDYNSDEEVFQGRTDNDFESVNYNATICHVKTGQIKDTTQIHVTAFNKHGGLTESDMKKVDEKNLHLLSDPNTYRKDDDDRATSSAPPSTKVSVASPIDRQRLVLNEHYRSENDKLDCLDNEDLSSKSKEELVELVRSLQRELETTKSQSLHSPTHQRHGSRRCASRQDSINEEDESNTPPSRAQPVSSLIHNFEQRNGGLRRSNTLPMRLRKPNS